jgi:tetratricopeptide (TPR) repeat protein
LGRARCCALTVPLLLGLASLSNAAETWMVARSPHFVVVSNAGERPARRVAHQFEQIRALFQAGFQVRLDPGRPFVILAVKDENSMKELAPDYWERRGGSRPAGFFFRGTDKHYVLLRLDVADDEKPHRVLYHEYVHLVTSLNYRWLPVWLNEGLAEFYETAEIDDETLRWGSIQPYYVHLLREQKLLPLAELLAVDHGSPHYNESGRVTMFYAQSAVLTHYLLLGSPERRGQLSGFAKLLMQGVPEEEAFSRTLGDVKKLDKEIQSYVARFLFSGLKAPAKVEAQTIQVRPLSPADSAAIRGDFLVRRGHGIPARKLLEQALAEAPDTSIAHESLGLLELREARYPEAVKHLTRAVELFPQNYLALYHGALAMAMIGKGPEDEARRERDLRRVIELNPQFSPAYDGLARLLLGTGQKLEEALSLANRACALDPAEIRYHLLAKHVLTRLGRTEEAARAEEGIVQAARSDPRALATVVFEYEHGERPELAEAMLRRAREVNPRSVPILEQLADYLSRHNRPADAEAVLRDALKLQPDSPHLQNDLAYLLAEGGTRANEALELIGKALKREPNNGNYLDTRGWALFKLKRLAEAEEALRKAVTEEPAEPVLQEHLGDVLLARGNRPGALEHWRRALSSDELSKEQRKALEAKVREAEKPPS